MAEAKLPDNLIASWLQRKGLSEELIFSKEKKKLAGAKYKIPGIEQIGFPQWKL